MFARLIRGTPALIATVLVAGAAAGAVGGAGNSPAEAPPAEIELRKTFRTVRRASQRPSPPEQRSDPDSAADIHDAAGETVSPLLNAVREALGEELQSSGTLHLPGFGNGAIVFQGSITPILQTVTGRRLIIDRERTIDPGVADEISRRWPDFAVVQPPAGAGLHAVIGSMLDAAGYDAVLRSAPLVFGRGITVRVTPDFVVHKSARDLLAGETRAISVLDPAEALPSELHELAGGYRVRIVELTPDGAPAGSPSLWRDPTGRVTTMEAPRFSAILEEIAVACGVSNELRVPGPADPGASEISVDPVAAVGALLERSDIPAIGPVVEFYRASPPGAPRRFVISVPGWLAESGGRRLLITGAAVPILVRLFLTRDGIDIFEYRIRS